ncbi:ImmA/IrrE family metallo-endopeptidase [Streptomyces sp. CA-132043]|uniref:ImmA/IrrE family metallo-endopeptidase n=1 Tax=Streptomyces sp. CA-132043 TaxID=3240048 RepID=UPI003D8C093B
MNWNVAHRIAGIAANQAHRDLAVDRTGYVHVHRALRTAGLIGMAQPMPRLFGVYFSVHDNGPAVLLNADLDVITQRHTAAHELGHHRLGHRSAYDQEMDPALRWGNGSWPEEEKVAEAFAAWFLMPRPAVLAALERVAGGPPRSPEHAYLVARALGTSYAGTVRHLVRLSQLDAGRAERWLKIAPAEVKRALAQGAAVPARSHVHVLTTALHGRCLHVDVGDVLVLQSAGNSFGSLPTGLVPRPDAAAGDAEAGAAPEHCAALDVTAELGSPARLVIDVAGHDTPLVLTIRREVPRTGLDDVWPM